MARAKRGRKRGGKKHPKSGTALLRSMKKQLTRIEHKVNPERRARIHAKRRSRHEESELASKYG